MTTNLSHNNQSRIGSHCWTHSPSSVETAVTAAGCGCRWIRATRSMQLDVVATGPRRYDFSLGDIRAVDTVIEQGMSIMGILDARWGNETLLNALPYASPIWEHLDLWEDFTIAAVQHYKDRVKYWEIINEPPFFWWYPTPEGVTIPEINPVMQRAPIWAYAELLKVSARAIRATDPEAKIVLGSGFYDGSFLQRLYEFGCRDAFDIASVHYLPLKHPGDFARAYNRVRQVMAEHGDTAKPLWDTESGPSGAIIGKAVETPADYEALTNVYRHCFAYEHGLDRYFWFNPPAGQDAGAPGLPSPYRALQTLTGLLGDGDLLRCAHYDDEVHAYVFQGVEGPVTVLWATAPAVLRVAGGADGLSYLGDPLRLDDAAPLTGRPIYLHGDVISALDVTVHGDRETVVQPMKQPAPATPTFTCPRHDGAGAPPRWEALPYLITHDVMPVAEQHDHFCKVTSSVAADMQMAYDEEALWLRVRVYDAAIDATCPTGLVQFTVRTGDPAVKEWSYWCNSFGLFSLYASPRGPLCLRHEHIYTDRYLSGRMQTATLQTSPLPDGLLYQARIPWAEIGPCQPGKYQPFLMMFTVNRADYILDLPHEDTPEEWSHNFADNFIVKDPSVTRWVEFA